MRYYFLGIAGTAMASIAALLKQKGHDVWGSDQGVYPPMSDFLEENEIEVISGYDVSNLDRGFDQAIIGNSLSRGNPEIEEILDRKLPFISLPELIRKEFIESHHNIVITGTHGKTTTTSLMSWVLEHANLSPTFMIGGIARNFDSSIQLGQSRYFVIEGDEYDCAFFDKRPKFVHYFPDHLIINNIEFDHADIYPDLETIRQEFRKLLRLVPPSGLVLANGDDPNVQNVIQKTHSRVQTFGSDINHDWSYRILETGNSGTRFEVFQSGRPLGTFSIPFSGEFQVQNALAVIAVATDIGISQELLASAISQFAGVKRRFEYWGTLHGAEVYDDFAHHPTAIKATLEGARTQHGHKRIIALFEPRTNTTVRSIFQDELAEALSRADVVISAPVHRQDRLPEDDRLSIEQLRTDLIAGGTECILLNATEDIPVTLRNTLRENDLLLLMTNGSLGGEYQRLRDQICHNTNGGYSAHQSEAVLLSE